MRTHVHTRTHTHEAAVDGMLNGWGTAVRNDGERKDPSPEPVVVKAAERFS